MKTPILLVAILIGGVACPNALLGQQLPKHLLFVPGYVILPNQDTLRGRLGDEIDAELGKRVAFLTDAERMTFYQPDELIGFAFENGRQFTAVQAPNDSLPVFAKLSQTGKITVYVHRIDDSSKEQFYLVRQDTPLIAKLVPPEKVEITQGDRTKIEKRETFRYELNRVLGEKGMDPEVMKLPYKSSKIEQFLRKKNDRSAEAYPIQTYQEATHSKLKLSAGIPVLRVGNQLGFRLDAAQVVQKVEKTRNRAIIRGLRYQYWNRNTPWDGRFDTGAEINWAHRLDLYPIGVRFETKERPISAYAYVGFGLSVGVVGRSIIENTEVVEQQVNVILTISGLGAMGLKFRVNSNYALIEVGPSVFPPMVFVSGGFEF